MTSVSFRRSTILQPKRSESLWKSFLKSAARVPEFENSFMIVLGKKNVGKTTLISELQKLSVDDRKLNSAEIYNECDSIAALSYAYLNVRDIEDNDISDPLAKCSIWVMQHTQHKYMLSEVFSPEYLKRLVVMICLDLTEPWNMLDELYEWFAFVNDILQTLFIQLPVEEQDTLRSNLTQYLNTYRSKTTGEDKEINYPLKINYGVPLIVCVCKSDAVIHLSTREYPGREDVILAYLRSVCISYGAALCYCCAKDPLSFRNLDLLYHYILHRIYGFKFNKPLTLESSDSIFVPAGWDLQAEIVEFTKTTVAENLDTPLESMLPSPFANQTEQKMEQKELTNVPSMDQFLQTLLAQEIKNDVKLNEPVLTKSLKESKDMSTSPVSKNVLPKYNTSRKSSETKSLASNSDASTIGKQMESVRKSLSKIIEKSTERKTS